MTIIKPKLILFLCLLTLILSGQKALAQATSTVCEDAIEKHLNTIDNSEIFFDDFNTNINAISSYQVHLFQRTLTERYTSLNELRKLFVENGVDQEPVCRNTTLIKLVELYDFSLLSESLFNVDETRRIVNSLTDYSPFKLNDFLSDYKSTLKLENIEITLNKASTDHELLLANSISLNIENNVHTIKTITKKDKVIDKTMTTVSALAKAWGKLSDRLKWRNGYLKNDKIALEKMQKSLKPFDLIFETRKFTLSNYTIPGHWGHVGVWLGTKEELISLGIWDRESFKPFRPFVEAGKSIVEIRKEGVNYQTLETFLNLDEIAITRIKGIESRASETIDLLAEQLDKKYDFKFNSHTLDKITCSEFITFSFGDLPWIETKTLFQKTLRPDDLALMTVHHPELAELVLYIKGQKKKKPALYLEFENWKSLYKTKKKSKK
jgi:uncharacterized protein YycO